ncbi:MAG TPA: hypothetical protein VK308_00430 [Pyrinomonadaceae bacterium]|nr:hypothetical protein [Pyrinomonadaceae bacterium]
MSEEQDSIFVSLVRESWTHYNETLQNTQMDELLVGAVIASTVEQGYSLIDLTSDGANHYLRFEDLQTRRRLLFQLHNLSEALETAKVLGRRARIVIGYGEFVQNVGAIWSALRSEFKSGFLDAAEPGVITTDADLPTGYIYVQVPLILNLDKYFGQNYAVNTELLQRHIQATVASLSKYLRGRIGG